MRWAALIAWVLAAAGGTFLLLGWLRHGGPRQREGIGTARLVPHASLAIAGLVAWIVFMATDERWLAWLAVGALVAVAALGIWMFATWARGRTRVEHTAVPAEAAFPLPVVLAHGALGAITILLSVLAAAGIGD